MFWISDSWKIIIVIVMLIGLIADAVLLNFMCDHHDNEDHIFRPLIIAGVIGLIVVFVWPTAFSCFRDQKARQELSKDEWSWYYNQQIVTDKQDIDLKEYKYVVDVENRTLILYDRSHTIYYEK